MTDTSRAAIEAIRTSEHRRLLYDIRQRLPELGEQYYPLLRTITEAAQQIDTLLSALEPRPENEFQHACVAWYRQCFDREPSVELDRRCHRFLEEALELYQALGRTEAEAMQLVRYVFGRESGIPSQEVGGVITTLAVLCSAYGLSMDACGQEELKRIHERIDRIREKDAAKPRFGPLPIEPRPAEVDAEVEEVREEWGALLSEQGPGPIPYDPINAMAILLSAYDRLAQYNARLHAQLEPRGDNSEEETLNV